MKRLHIITKPTSVAELADLDTDNFTNNWQLKAERLQARRQRQFRQQFM